MKLYYFYFFTLLCTVCIIGCGHSKSEKVSSSTTELFKKPIGRLSSKNYKQISERETNNIAAGVQLNENQKSELRKVNDLHFQRLANIMESQFEPGGRKKAINDLNDYRNKELKRIFTASQYAKFTADMAMFKKRADERLAKMQQNRKPGKIIKVPYKNQGGLNSNITKN